MWTGHVCRGLGLIPSPGYLPEPLPAPPEAWLGKSCPPGGGRPFSEEPVTALLFPLPAPQTSLRKRRQLSPSRLAPVRPSMPCGSGRFACPAETGLAVDRAPLLPGPPREELEGHGGSGLGREELRGEAAVPDPGQGQSGLRAGAQPSWSAELEAACRAALGSEWLRSPPRAQPCLFLCPLPALPPVSPGEAGSSEPCVLLLSWAWPSEAMGSPSLVCLHGFCSCCSSALTSCLNGPPERPG